MTADNDLAAKVRAALVGIATTSEVKMFGGIAFMLNGNMMAAASRRGLLLRVGKDRSPDALARPGVRAMEMRGRVMEGYVYADPAALKDEALLEWLRTAQTFVQTLPPKTARAKPAAKAKRK